LVARDNFEHGCSLKPERFYFLDSCGKINVTQSDCIVSVDRLAGVGKVHESQACTHLGCRQAPLAPG
jgi:hypothetical protein